MQECFFTIVGRTNYAHTINVKNLNIVSIIAACFLQDIAYSTGLYMLSNDNSTDEISDQQFTTFVQACKNNGIAIKRINSTNNG